MKKSYLEWCEIMSQKPNERDQVIFTAGAMFNSIDQKKNRECEHEYEEHNYIALLCSKCGHIELEY